MGASCAIFLQLLPCITPCCSETDKDLETSPAGVAPWKQQAAETNFREIKISEARLSEAKAKEAKLAEAKLMSISIAMVMAVVAMLGAVTAYRAALAEQETLRVERRLQQGVMLELEHRQELLSKVSSRTRYEHSAGAAYDPG